MNIAIVGDVCLEKKDIASLNKLGSVRFYEKKPTSQQEIIQQIGDADLLISALVPLTKEVLDAAKNLKFITLATTGVDDIDLEVAKEKQITVCYTPDYATQAVAEFALGLMVAVSRRSFIAANDVKMGSFESCAYQGEELRGKTLGIVGYGRIGKRVAEIAHTGFNMNSIYTDHNSTKNEFEKLLQQSDIISLHAPLTPQTYHMIKEEQFSLMKHGVIVINTARGGLIDEEALLKNVVSRKVFAAGLDVVESEPIQKDNPLLKHPYIIVTPHIAYNSKQALVLRSNIVTENIQKYIDGRPQNVVGSF